jgi:hypothetical protein
MKGLVKLFVLVGILLIVLACIMRLTWLPIVISGKPIKASSLLILANTSFLFALLSRK